jgi:predicted enzyme related to lactoylglutathione lyase
MNRPTHFEIPADDPTRAAKFYTGVFGWQFKKWEGPMEYWMVTTGASPAPGIDGGLSRRERPGASTVNTIGVESVDRTVESIGKHGGTIVAPKMAIPGVGWLAYAQDPEGNTFGVMQNDPQAG